MNHPGPERDTLHGQFAARVHALRGELEGLYGPAAAADVLRAILSTVAECRPVAQRPPPNSFDPRQLGAEDVLLITYGNTLERPGEMPLATLRDFIRERLDGVVNAVHVLPFFPFSSDDGFAVIDFYSVDPALGDWSDITALSAEVALMADLVINHVSRESLWFMDFVNDSEPGRDFFLALEPDTDVSRVVRPRNTPLLVPIHTYRGMRHVWATFSEDQIDLDFSKPRVLAEMVRVLCNYLRAGARLIRLDAIAYLWKEVGTPCIHHPNTHAVVRILRLLSELMCDPDRDPVVLITETNVPHSENVSYFGHGDEAHMVYQFSLAPLVLHALTRGSSRYLMQWGAVLDPPPEGCAFLNFTASHDGIGLRPAEGLVPEQDIDVLVELMHAFGGFVSMRMLADGSQRPYEINIALFDALRGTFAGEDHWQVQRFLCSQVLAMSLQGVPAIYIHSLLGTGNHIEGVERSGRTRSINRRQWQLAELEELLADPATATAQVFAAMSGLLRLRRSVAAFAPCAAQVFVPISDDWVTFIRGEGDAAVAVVINVTAGSCLLDEDARAALFCQRQVRDLITGETFPADGSIEVTPYRCLWLQAH
ncbi:MAG: sugar phosphorylase [Gammaproteobacteria bacterium]|nr:sugar phosphorylase [Gammaproteobacteria bacterium]